MIDEHSLVTAAVLSGNRNFEARVHPQVRANYLASPMLVVAFALAGRVDIDLQREPLGTGKDGRPVFLRDIWPTPDGSARGDGQRRSSRSCSSAATASVFEGDETWQALEVPEGSRYAWDPASTYVQEPPFFLDLPAEPPAAPRHHRRPGAGRAGRLGHDGPHLAGGLDSQERAGRALPAGARGRAGGLEHLRLPPRQPRSDDARHLRQRAHQQRAGPRARRATGRSTSRPAR